MDFCQDFSDYSPGAKNVPAPGQICFTYTYIGKNLKNLVWKCKAWAFDIWYVSLPRGPLTMSVQIFPLGWRGPAHRGVGVWVWLLVLNRAKSHWQWLVLGLSRPRTIKLIGRMDLKSRWHLSQRSRSPWPLVQKKLIILQCLWLGPSNLVEMLVLTSRWSWGQRSRSPGPLVLKSLITWQCLGIGPSNLEGMLVFTSRWHCGQSSCSRSPWPLALKSL